MSDSYGRQFSYLRLSITDVCNFSCVYCLPDGYKKPLRRVEPLNLDEILRLARAFAELGTRKIRLTGGEPTLRRDFLDIARGISRISGIEKVALSTNGRRLRELAPALKDAGVQALNVSVDSLDPKIFAEITGQDTLSEIIDGVEYALELGFKSVKLNSVLLAGKNDNSETFIQFSNWLRTRAASVRFIELMPNHSSEKIFSTHHTRANELREKLLLEGWSPQIRGSTDGPAEEFAHPDYEGRFGLIAPYRKDFCATCNRLRVTSTGQLRLCLFAEENQSLRPWLQNDNQKVELKERLCNLVGHKKVSHFLQEGNYGDNRTFSAIGG